MELDYSGYAKGIMSTTKMESIIMTHKFNCDHETC